SPAERDCAIGTEAAPATVAPAPSAARSAPLTTTPVDRAAADCVTPKVYPVALAKEGTAVTAATGAAVAPKAAAGPSKPAAPAVPSDSTAAGIKSNHSRLFWF